jgi:diguanylate cyclase (GGDEF)-like protein
MDSQLITGVILLFILSFLLWWNLRLQALNRNLLRSEGELKETLETDPLTGLGNRIAMTRLRDSAEPINGVVTVIDLDEMKRINDELGHLAGDEVLSEVGNLIRASVRREDVACRWGGDEFVILFRNKSLETVENRMQQIQARLWRFRLRSFGVFPLRISWGAAEARETPLAEALAAADERMYRMKRSRKSSAAKPLRSALSPSARLVEEK